MHSAHDLLTRWPALDVAAKRARPQGTFQCSPGPLHERFAAAALWRREPGVWSSDPTVQPAIATPPAQTFDILASHSGSTIEPDLLVAYFRQRLESVVARWNDYFVALYSTCTCERLSPSSWIESSMRC
jgi:hypothetical protein